MSIDFRTPFSCWLARAVVVCLLSGLSDTFAAESAPVAKLKTKRGDVLVGTIQSRENGKIVFHSDTFGTFTVDEASVSVESGEPKPQKSHPSLDANKIPHTLPPNLFSPLQPLGAGGQPHASNNKIREFLHMPDELMVTFQGGFGHLDGTANGKNFDGKIQLDYNKGRYVGQLTGQYLYGKYNGTIATDEHEIIGRVSRYFGEDGGDHSSRRYFAMMQHQYEVNRIRSIDFDYDFYGGLGIDVHKNQKSSSIIAVGGNFEIEQLSGLNSAGMPMSQTELGRAFVLAGLQWQLNERIALNNTLGYQVKPSDASNYELQWYSTLSYALTDALSINLNYHLEYDDTEIVGIDESTSRLTLSLGYQL